MKTLSEWRLPDQDVNSGLWNMKHEPTDSFTVPLILEFSTKCFARDLQVACCNYSFDVLSQNMLQTYI
jgi:hypothetical protein